MLKKNIIPYCHFDFDYETRLYDSNTKTNKLRIRTRNVQNTCENISLLC